MRFMCLTQQRLVGASQRPMWVYLRLIPVLMQWKENTEETETFFSLIYWDSFKNSWGGFTDTCLACRAVFLPPEPPTPTPHLDIEVTFVEEESWWELIKLSNLFLTNLTWRKRHRKRFTSCYCSFIIFNAGNQDKWHSLPGSWDLDVVRNVCLFFLTKCQKIIFACYNKSCT